MPKTAIRLLGLATGLHGFAKYANWKYETWGFNLGSSEDVPIDPPTYLDVWVLLPNGSTDWQNLSWVFCGLVLIRFSKQFSRLFPSRGG
jgi:hypothetical protein